MNSAAKHGDGEDLIDKEAEKNSSEHLSAKKSRKNSRDVSVEEKFKMPNEALHLGKYHSMFD